MSNVAVDDDPGINFESQGVPVGRLSIAKLSVGVNPSSSIFTVDDSGNTKTEDLHINGLISGIDGSDLAIGDDDDVDASSQTQFHQGNTISLDESITIASGFKRIDEFLTRAFIDTPPAPTITHVESLPVTISIDLEPPPFVQSAFLNIDLPHITTMTLRLRTSSTQEHFINTIIASGSNECRAIKKIVFHAIGQESYPYSHGISVDGITFNYFQIEALVPYDIEVVYSNEQGDQNIFPLKPSTLLAISTAITDLPPPPTVSSLSYHGYQGEHGGNASFSVSLIRPLHEIPLDSYRATATLTGSQRYPSPFSPVGTQTMVKVQIQGGSGSDVYIIEGYDPGSSYDLSFATSDTIQTNVFGMNSVQYQVSSDPPVNALPLQTGDAGFLTESIIVQAPYSNAGSGNGIGVTGAVLHSLLDGNAVDPDVYIVPILYTDGGGIITISMDSDRSSTEILANPAVYVGELRAMLSTYTTGGTSLEVYTDPIAMTGFGASISQSATNTSTTEAVSGSGLLSLNANHDGDMYPLNAGSVRGFHRTFRGSASVSQQSASHNITYGMSLRYNYNYADSSVGVSSVIVTNPVRFHVDTLSNPPVVGMRFISSVTGAVAWASGIPSLIDGSSYADLTIEVDNLAHKFLRGDRKMMDMHIVNLASEDENERVLTTLPDLTLWREDMDGTTPSRSFWGASGLFTPSVDGQELVPTEGGTLPPDPGLVRFQGLRVPIPTPDTGGSFYERMVVRIIPTNLAGYGDVADASAYKETNTDVVRYLRMDTLTQSVIRTGKNPYDPDSGGKQVHPGPDVPFPSVGTFGYSIMDNAPITNHELAMSGGLFKTPSCTNHPYINYAETFKYPSTITPPDYSDLASTSSDQQKFVAFQFTDIRRSSDGGVIGPDESFNRVRIEILGSQGLESNLQTGESNFTMHIRVSSPLETPEEYLWETKWHDANIGIGLVGVSHNFDGSLKGDGTPCAVTDVLNGYPNTNSNRNVAVISGTPASCVIHVRIGLPNSTCAYFQGVRVRAVIN